MICSRKTLSLTILSLAVFGLASAQGLTPQAKQQVLAAPINSQTAAAADFIVAVVNAEPITNVEVHRQAQFEQQQLLQSGQQPASSELDLIHALQTLIDHKAQLQLARDTGLAVESSALEQAEQTIAMQNQLDVAQLHQRMESEGQSVAEFRRQLADRILLQRLQERDIEPRLQVSDQEADQFLQDQAKTDQAYGLDLNMAQILIPVPDSASPEQVASLRAQATEILQRARRGDDFAALAREFSAADDKNNGGEMGLRSSSRYPELFVQATAGLATGQVADLVRSPAGFHILKLLQKNQPNNAAAVLTQNHARHIVLLPSAELSQQQARQKLLDFKRDIIAGKADFETLARQYSQDGSAASGGDLGWLDPGTLVPEFEAAMNQLLPGQISDPVPTRFGLHLIELLERRQVSLTAQQQREAARALLREKKAERIYRDWTQKVRARAYIEMRQPPQ